MWRQAKLVCASVCVCVCVCVYMGDVQIGKLTGRENWDMKVGGGVLCVCAFIGKMKVGDSVQETGVVNRVRMRVFICAFLCVYLYVYVF